MSTPYDTGYVRDALWRVAVRNVQASGLRNFGQDRQSKAGVSLQAALLRYIGKGKDHAIRQNNRITDVMSQKYIQNFYGNRTRCNVIAIEKYLLKHAVICGKSHF
ncbi:MAG: hypothetical protein FWG04_01030 [Desulfovibrionaceae bacterium]|nr:hypothetical protein [Desulfovibrionaceae bacterium]